jgi:hypothetical protein
LNRAGARFFLTVFGKLIALLTMASTFILGGPGMNKKRLQSKKYLQWLMALAVAFFLGAPVRAQSMPSQANQPTQDNDTTRQELAQFDRFLDSHREIGEQLRKNSSLINDKEFLAKHPALQTYLQQHPAFRQEIRENPNAFMRQENRFDRHGEARENDAARRDRDTESRDTDNGRRDNDATRRDNDNARPDSDATRRDNDSARRDSDATRRDNDSARRDNDATRRNDDNARQDSDATRRDNDSARRDNDATRGNDDNARRDSDATRRDNDSARRDNDATRGNDENARRDNDAMRRDNDNARRDNDATRGNDENARRDNDAMRRDNDNARRDNDATHRDNDTARRDTGTTRRELARFDQFADSHREIGEQLRKNPSLVNNKEFVQNHPALQAYLQEHPGIREDMKENPNAFMHQENRFDRHEDAGYSGATREHLASFGEFLSGHSSVAKQVSKDPSLVKNDVYVKNHPELQAYLDTHPDVRGEMKQDPQSFIKSAQQFNVKNGAQAPKITPAPTGDTTKPKQ